MATSNKKKLYYNEVVKKNQEGKSYAVISKELSLGVKTVEHWVHDFLGYTPRSSRPTMRTLYFDKAMALYQNGSSVKDIANQFPVCVGTVALWVHEYKRAHPESYSKTLKETYYDEAIRLNKEKGIGAAKISKIIPVSAATISLWLRNFAADSADTAFSEQVAKHTLSEEQMEANMKREASIDGDLESLRKEIADD